MALSDDLRMNIGSRTSKGTKITQTLVDKVQADEKLIKIVEDNREEVINGIGEAILRGLNEVGQMAETYAKALAPVDTGRLRNSITHIIDPDANEVYIGTNVEYARHQEYGRHAANGGRGFLRPAASEHGSEYRAAIEEALRNA